MTTVLPTACGVVPVHMFFVFWWSPMIPIVSLSPCPLQTVLLQAPSLPQEFAGLNAKLTFSGGLCPSGAASTPQEGSREGRQKRPRQRATPQERQKNGKKYKRKATKKSVCTSAPFTMVRTFLMILLWLASFFQSSSPHQWHNARVESVTSSASLFSKPEHTTP